MNQAEFLGVCIKFEMREKQIKLSCFKEKKLILKVLQI